MKVELLRPSELGPSERACWREIIAQEAVLQRGFLTASFARACEAAHGRAMVAILHEGGTARGFLAFQHRSAWHRRVGLGERIGGELADAAGLVARPDTRVDPAELLRACRLGALFLTHLRPGQDALGLAASEWRIGHEISIHDGPAAYFAMLNEVRRSFVQDTERRLRRAERDHGALTFSFDSVPCWNDVADLIRAKRDQYHRTGAHDGFVETWRLRLLEMLLAEPSAECRLVLTRLAAGEHVLARQLGLLCHGVLSYWFPAYDPAAQKISPGRLLLWHTLQRAADIGIRLIDRGEGDSEAKRDFSTGTVQFGTANWTSGTWRTVTTRLWQAARWRLRTLRAPLARSARPS
jgi:CelD/BcsL family acetyltransferase involved in cellulose biosynthesis